MQDCRIADCAVRTCIPVECNSALRTAYSALPIQAARSGILRASGRFEMAVR